MAFTRAQRHRAKARILIEGPSGSGKSYGALLLAKGLGGRVAAIDTEHGSLSMYSDLLDFDVMELGAPFSPRRYIEAIKEAEAAGYDTLIIDSISHEWEGEGGIQDILDRTPAPGGNSFGRWAVVTPQHNRFVEAMLQSSMHVIATTRTKTEWALDEKKPRKIGTAPKQRDGLDYEFTTVFSVQADSHTASVTKDRTAQFDGYLQMLDVETGKRIVDWLEAAPEAPPKVEAKPKPQPPKDDPAAGHRAAAKALLDEMAGKGVGAHSARVALIRQFGGEQAKLNDFDAQQCAAFVEFLTAKQERPAGSDRMEDTSRDAQSKTTSEEAEVKA